MSKDGLGPLVHIEGEIHCVILQFHATRHYAPYVLDGLFRNGRSLFQMDKSPGRMARKATDVLENHGARTLLWLPNGADASPMCGHA